MGWLSEHFVQQFGSNYILEEQTVAFEKTMSRHLNSPRVALQIIAESAFLIKE